MLTELEYFKRLLVLKRNDGSVPYSRLKVIDAVRKTIEATNLTGSIEQESGQASLNELGGLQRLEDKVADLVEARLIELDYSKVCVETISNIVEHSLLELGQVELARAFIAFRASKAELRKIKPDEKAIVEYIKHSKYVRPENKTFKLTLNSLKLMYLAQLHKLAIRSNKELDPLITGPTIVEDSIEKIYDGHIVPSMRSLQFAGRAIEVNNTRIYNCSYLVMDDHNNFTKIFYLLLCGCGVGYSVQTHHISKIRSLTLPNDKIIDHYVIEDTIEGWSFALGKLIASYIKGSYNQYVEFNYSKIRQEGSNLATSGGKAPGHLPLKKLLDKVRGVLNNYIENYANKFMPALVHQIICLTAEAVLSGGIRRASLMCLFSLEDDELLICKKGDWMSYAPHLRMANNSVVLNPDNKDHLARIPSLLEVTKHYGEPGLFFTNDPNCGTNPCGEIGLDPFDPVTNTNGVAFCNLTEVNAAACTNEQEFLDCCSYAAFLGTLQSSFTNFHPLLGEATKNIAVNTPLLGVSITGILDNIKVIDWLDRAVKIVKHVNKSWSIILGIKPAIRLTTIKPSGTASLLLGNVSSGIHPHHSKRYIRRVTANRNEAALLAYAKSNPLAVKRVSSGSNDRDYIIEFPVLAKEGSITLDKLTAIEHLEIIKSVYNKWVLPGYVDGKIGHNVSATVQVDENEWDLVADWILRNEYFHPISFFPRTGDKVYVNAPRESVKTKEEIEHWKNLITSYVPVDYGDYRVSDEDVFDPGNACEGASCEF